MSETSHTEVKKWYNNKYKTNGAQTMRPEYAYDIFINHLNVKAPGSLLDVACGTGYLLKKAAEKGLDVSGIDLSDKAVEVARSIVPNATLKVCSAEHLPFNENSFNYVSCLGSIEHFLDPSIALQEMKRVSKSNATYLFVVPNKNFLFDFITGNHGTEQQDIKETLRSLKQWKTLFDQSGFEIINIKHDYWIRDSLYTIKPSGLLDWLKIHIKKMVWAVLPMSLSYQFIFVLRKKA